MPGGISLRCIKYLVVSATMATEYLHSPEAVGGMNIILSGNLTGVNTLSDQSSKLLEQAPWRGQACGKYY